MDGFCKAAEQSCHLCIHDRGNLTVVAQVNSPSTWGMSLRLGARVSLLDTGSGHVLLAFQTELRRAEMVREHEPIEGGAVGQDHVDADRGDLVDLAGSGAGGDRLDREVNAFTVGKLPDLGNHVAVSPVDHVCRPHCPGQFQLRKWHIDGDHLRRRAKDGALHGVDSNTSAADDQHAAARAHPGRVRCPEVAVDEPRAFRTPVLRCRLPSLDG